MCKTKELTNTQIDTLTQAINRLSDNLENALKAQPTMSPREMAREVARQFNDNPSLRPFH